MSSSELQRLRGEVDRVDDGILALLTERMHLVDAIGAHKSAAGLPPRDESREAEILERVKNAAGDCGDEAETLFRCLLSLGLARQEKRLERTQKL